MRFGIVLVQLGALTQLRAPALLHARIGIPPAKPDAHELVPDHGRRALAPAEECTDVLQPVLDQAELGRARVRLLALPVVRRTRVQPLVVVLPENALTRPRYLRTVED